MDNKENTIDKTKETLTKELESLSSEGLHEFFKFFYKLNHQHGNMIAVDKFEEFLESFDSNPFKVNDDKTFRKQLIENIIEYAHDYIFYQLLLKCLIFILFKRVTVEGLKEFLKLINSNHISMLMIESVEELKELMQSF